MRKRLGYLPNGSNELVFMTNVMNLVYINCIHSQRKSVGSGYTCLKGCGSNGAIVVKYRMQAPKLLGGKISEDSPLVDLLCSKCRLPVTDARQTIDCGCRLCGHCYTVLDDRY